MSNKIFFILNLADVIPIERNKSIGAIPVLHEEFDISFELYINRAPTGTWHNVLRLTNTNNDKGNSSGDRIAMIEIHGDMDKMILYFGKDRRGGNITHNATIPTKTWIHIRIQQALVNGRYYDHFYDNQSLCIER